MDVVVTTRLHGLVLGLKHGVPVLAVDPVEGGAKVRRQAEVLGWPHVLVAESASVAALEAGFLACLTEEARGLARTCAERARAELADTRHAFVTALRRP
jgi:polysaccharide pyruvyl transferase WcaK-like protein